jgi:hypothetical protein
MVAIKSAMAAVAVSVFTLMAQAGDAGGRNDGSMSIHLKHPVLVSGVTVAPGAYKVSWVREHGSEDVRLAIARGRKVVASGHGHWIESAQPSSFEALVFHPDSGMNELAEIRFEQSTESILIDGATTRAEGPRTVAPATD